MERRLVFFSLKQAPKCVLFVLGESTEMAQVQPTKEKEYKGRQENNTTETMQKTESGQNLSYAMYRK
jgi:hypothetical protein